jgi:hypothetical protein
MRIPYDILKKQADGSFTWIEAMANLRAATRRIEELSGRSPGEYWVFDQRSLVVVAKSASDQIPPYSNNLS